MQICTCIYGRVALNNLYFNYKYNELIPKRLKKSYDETGKIIVTVVYLDWKDSKKTIVTETIPWSFVAAIA